MYIRINLRNLSEKIAKCKNFNILEKKNIKHDFLKTKINNSENSKFHKKL